ncbi:MAG: hypothetical protein JWL84_4342 [Rhodospirillales bacterium]|nr:hypothetical protein [Rhodospirillales bacterium]
MFSGALAAPQAARRIDLLVLQPTPFCNLNCDYCYLPNRASRARMSMGTLDTALKCAFESGWVSDRLTVVWHAGEPLTLPVDYYREAFAVTASRRPPNIGLDHSIQTNGVLIDEAWCSFLTAHEVRLGVSLDGPAFLHDAHRQTRAGGGTFEKVMRGIRCLQEHAVPFHVITVLTRASLDFPEQLYEFFVGAEIGDVGFNIEEIEAEHTESSLGAAGTTELFGSFLARFLRLVRTGPARLRVREFVGAYAAIRLAGSGTRHNHQVDPFGIVSIDHAGNVSTFSPELLGQRRADYGNFIFGNVHHDDLHAIERMPTFRKLRDEIERGVTRCRETCEYFSVCGGGAPANKLYELGTFEGTETMYCRLTKKTVLDVVLEDLKAHPPAIGSSMDAAPTPGSGISLDEGRTSKHSEGIACLQDSLP